MVREGQLEDETVNGFEGRETELGISCNLNVVNIYTLLEQYW